MELEKLLNRAREIRNQYSELEIKRNGRSWTPEEIALGFVGDVGDLVKLVIAKEGARDVQDVDEKLPHELADCLWSIFILSDYYGVDLESSFEKTMLKIEKEVKEKLNKSI